MQNDASIKSADREELERELAPFGQQHLLRFWNELNGDQQQRLAAQIHAIDFPAVQQLLGARGSDVDWAALAKRAEPPPAFRLDGRGNSITVEAARAAGEAALRRGEVGAILVAGGQGSRLGFHHPKGMYSIGPVSGASLFQILFEKLVAVGRRYSRAVPLFLMTSPATHDETVEYLAKQNRFGIATEDLQIFCQGQMPAADPGSGKILLTKKGEVALSPDGHGGMLAALARWGGLAEIQRRGLKHLFYFQVDNPMVVACDPVLIGYHILSQSELSTLAIAKVDPLERVGNVVQLDGHLQIIEYSDLPAEAAHVRNPDGSLRIWAGSIAVHVFDAAFLQNAARDHRQLPFHVARKKVAYVDENGQMVEPAQPNALKFERFIFDLLPAAQRAIVVETDAARTFAAVKNEPGAPKETRDTCRGAMIALYREWLTSAGAKVNPHVAVEISPLYALDATAVREKISPGTTISAPTYFAGDASRLAS